MESDCRHVAPNDNQFTARMRFHQSWYRHYVLNLSPGENPAARGQTYGNMLRNEDGSAGRNFLTCEIYELAEKRMRDKTGTVERERLRRNMLSSQPMCFNLFGPAAIDLSLGTQLFRELPGLPSGIQIKMIAFEFAPDRTTHLDYKTAFDALVDYVRPDGSRGFIGIETKLTEPFSQTSYDFGPRYSRWKETPGWLWKRGSEVAFGDKRLNQIWRNHLLAFAHLHQRNSVYSEGYCAVVYHENDTACKEALRRYQDYLREEALATLLDWPLGNVIERWSEQKMPSVHRTWIDEFRRRYLTVEASQQEWDEYRRKLRISR
jgi:hypothetical protein